MKKLEALYLLRSVQFGELEDVCFNGRVKKVRNLGGIQFLIVHDQTDSIQVVFSNKIKISRGSHVNVLGTPVFTDGRLEIQAKDIRLLGTMNSTVENVNFFSERRLEQLYWRSLAIEAVHQYFIHNYFMLVHSPAIVGNWVEGQTGSFPLDFYGSDCNLTISNMMYHEIMMINGFSKIYELAKIFRKEHPSSIYRLAEFTIIDIGLAYKTSIDMIRTVEGMIYEIHRKLLQQNIDGMDKEIFFEYISYKDLVAKADSPNFNGAQFPKKVRTYLNEHYNSFVWVTGFPERKRPFFVRSEDGTCFDYQLWYKGTIYLAAGGERETNVARICEKIKAEGKSVSNYEQILKNFNANVPPMCGIGMGIERFLGFFLPNSTVADYVAFPRYQNHYTP